jgi:hypothetical protein
LVARLGFVISGLLLLFLFFVFPYCHLTKYLQFSSSAGTYRALRGSGSMVFAAVITSRKAQIPATPGSSSELTTILAPFAAMLVSAKTAVIATASVARILVAVHCRAAEVVHPSPAWRIAESWLTIVTSAISQPKGARRVRGPDALVFQVSAGRGFKTRSTGEQYKSELESK